jgi:adenosylmethionine-8-amino-7-oxononanoate aminotransferase
MYSPVLVSTPATAISHSLGSKPGSRLRTMPIPSPAAAASLTVSRFPGTNRGEILAETCTISLEASYHGHGFGAFGLSRAASDTRLGPFLPDPHHVSPYWAEGGAERMLADMRQALERSSTGTASVLAEPIRSNVTTAASFLSLNWMAGKLTA